MHQGKLIKAESHQSGVVIEYILQTNSSTTVGKKILRLGFKL